MIAGIFPGDGSEYPGMSELIGSCDIEPIDVDFNIRNINEGVLKDRLNAQVSVYLVSTFLWDRFRDVIEISFVSGHSLGFYSALYAAGVITRKDGVEILKTAYSAIKEVTSGVEGGMTAIIGLKSDIINDICKGIPDVSIANINSATQVVVSGLLDHIGKVEEIVLREGALDVKRLNIDAPLHSLLMNGIGDLIGEGIKDIELSGPGIPVVDHTSPEILDDVDKIRDVLCNQLTRRVLWRDAVSFMQEQGVHEYIEVGPSDVLSKIVRW
ncbi:MAG: ACP S-malonyltransferase, partial [Thermodesulfovibrionales bacterium]